MVGLMVKKGDVAMFGVSDASTTDDDDDVTMMSDDDVRSDVTVTRRR